MFKFKKKISLKLKDSKLEKSELFYLVKRISYIRKYIKTSQKLKKLYNFFRLILLAKLKLKKKNSDYQTI